MRGTYNKVATRGIAPGASHFLRNVGYFILLGFFGIQPKGKGLPQVEALIGVPAAVE